jgi:hypothetical protein
MWSAQAQPKQSDNDEGNDDVANDVEDHKSYRRVAFAWHA